jgi:lipoprotein-anchoring transpeptidase ErfK/SrfK
MAKRIVVDLSRQLLYAYDGEELIHCFDCVSGDHDHPTPVGDWGIYRKHETYRSRTYDAQMDYAMFFKRTGEAIHEGYAVGPMSYARAALEQFGLQEHDPFGSHGCVRLAGIDARTLFDWAPIGTRVHVVRTHSPVQRSAGRATRRSAGRAASDPRMLPNHIPGRRS